MTDTHDDGTTPSPPSAIASFAAALGLSAAIPFVLWWGFDAELRWLALGAASWIAGIVIKVPAVALTHRAVTSLDREETDDRSLRASIPRAAALGFASALSELLPAALIFTAAEGHTARPIDLLAFGAGAGCFENILLLCVASFEPPDAATLQQWTQGARESWWVRHTTVLERTIALLLHLGTFGLIGLSLQRESAHLALIALLVFTAVDGAGDLAESQRWILYAPRVFLPFFSFLAAAAGGACLLLMAALRA